MLRPAEGTTRRVYTGTQQSWDPTLTCSSLPLAAWDVLPLNLVYVQVQVPVAPLASTLSFLNSPSLCRKKSHNSWKPISQTRSLAFPVFSRWFLLINLEGKHPELLFRNEETETQGSKPTPKVPQLRNGRAMIWSQVLGSLMAWAHPLYHPTYTLSLWTAGWVEMNISVVEFVCDLESDADSPAPLNTWARSPRQSGCGWNGGQCNCAQCCVSCASKKRSQCKLCLGVTLSHSLLLHIP